MQTRIYKHFAMLFLMVLPLVLRAQETVKRSELLNKDWRIVGMKCSGDNGGDEDRYIHYYASFTLSASNPNNINYGTYVMKHRDQSDNPIEYGTYSISWDETTGTWLTMLPHHGKPVMYVVEMVSAHHLTLIQQGDDIKCNTSYAIAP